MSQLTILLLIAICCFAGMFYFNATNFKLLKQLSIKKDKELNDAKYWELKYKYEFLIAIVTLITATAGFLGYNSLQSIETSIKADFNKKVDSIKNTLQTTYNDVNSKLTVAKGSVSKLNNQVKSSQTQLQTNVGILKNLASQQFKLKEIGYQSKKSLLNLSGQIDSINTKNKIKREFYLIPNKEFKGQNIIDYIQKNTRIRLSFNDLRTVSGDRLPIFKKSPIVLSAFSNTTEFQILNIDKDGFEGSLNAYGEAIDEKIAKNSYYISFIIYSTD